MLSYTIAILREAKEKAVKLAHGEKETHEEHSNHSSRPVWFRQEHLDQKELSGWRV